MKGLEDMFCEEMLRALGLSGFKKRRLRGDLITLCNFLKRDNGKGGTHLFWSPTTEHDRMT